MSLKIKRDPAFEAKLAQILRDFEKTTEAEVRRKWREEHRLIFVNARPYFRAYRKPRSRQALRLVRGGRS